MPSLVAFDANQPQKPEIRANIKLENNSNDGCNVSYKNSACWQA
jgi:hypothetical protein